MGLQVTLGAPFRWSVFQVASVFLDLDDKQKFLHHITPYYQKADSVVSSVIECKIRFNDIAIEDAYKKYLAYVSYFSASVRSGNPDQYKRAAALTKALIEAPINAEATLPTPIDELEDGFSPVSFHHADVRYALPTIQLYHQYCNYIIAFSIGFEFCGLYEDKLIRCSMDYLRNMCAYLKYNKDVSVDTLFIIFKSLMHSC